MRIYIYIIVLMANACGPGVLLSLHILTGNYVNLCFVIVYKLPDAPTLHASELYSRILEHSSSPQAKVAQPLEKQSLLASIKTGE